jgi:hypothetical protein
LWKRENRIGERRIGQDALDPSERIRRFAWKRTTASIVNGKRFFAD